MANLATWHMTNMPSEIVDIFVKDSQKIESESKASLIQGDVNDKSIRNSKNSWITTDNWISGWLWYYISKTNRENFCYDLTDIDGGSIQYTQYGPGEFYSWHSDADLDTFYQPQFRVGSSVNMREDQTILQGEYVRKLSFVLQLSDPTDYRGGELQFMDNKGGTFFAPKQKGTIIMFDSRVKHRVRKVREGLRRSLVGWVVGPRWK